MRWSPLQAAAPLVVPTWPEVPGSPPDVLVSTRALQRRPRERPRLALLTSRRRVGYRSRVHPRRATWIDETSEVLTACPPTRDVGGLLVWAAEVGGRFPLPGGGRTLERWRLLAGVGAHDLTAARVLEPHVDALAILAEAGLEPFPVGHPGATYGVYAAEGPGARLEATQAPSGEWVLTGRKPWCSLAGHVSHALVTAWVDDERRGLFRVGLRHPGVEVEADAWAPTGLVEVVTATVQMDAVPAEPVGAPGWYLERGGFAWGGLGVAAIWYGGAVGLARRLLVQAGRREPDQVALMHLGAVDAVLATARTSLAAAAAEVDAGDAGDSAGPAGRLMAARVRQVVADAVDVVQQRVAHALGPGPLAHEPAHARRVADLALYVRQHHAERDQAALGRLLLDRREAGDGPDW